MARALKVFRTPIGFHDAYVAAPTQKAALEAWGSDANLFARGVAEIVTDPKLTAEPLAKPGEVIKRLRGTAEEHFGALPKVKQTGAKTPVEPKVAKSRKAAPAKLSPRPSRAKLDAAEQRVSEAEQGHAAALQTLKRREDALRAERQKLEAQQAAELNKLEQHVEKAKTAYDSAVQKWRAID